MQDWILKLARGLSEVDRAAWDYVANPADLPFDPFLSWDFLEALEQSGAATAETGWSPHHVLIEDGENTLLAAMPMYAKTHSQGEFIFDYGWADAFERAGGQYYPKLLIAVPFTPVTGRRRLVPPGPDADALKDALLSGALQIAAQNHLSSVHMNFIEPLEYESLGAQGMLQRRDQQFHWRNDGYDTFDDFLAALSSAKRKNLRKERAKAQAGLRFDRLTGDDLKPEHWDIFYDFYMDTGARKWGSPYLNRETFELIHHRMADKCLLVFAYEDTTPIAGAFNMIGSDTLYGRYWGRIEERPFLHFEVCYYQAIDFAIERKLSTVEAGAQGAHKLARGYVPTPTSSVHWIANEGFRAAVENYLQGERDAVSRDIDYLNARTPFKKEG